MKDFTKKEIDEMKFRISCLNPKFDGSPIPTCSTISPDGIEEQHHTFYGKICAHGTSMTIKEMNENIIWKGKPYIKIPYCKYCYTEDTIGILDDEPQLFGLYIDIPNAENPLFSIHKMDENNHKKWMETFDKRRNKK